MLNHFRTAPSRFVRSRTLGYCFSEKNAGALTTFARCFAKKSSAAAAAGKLSALEMALRQIESAHGKGSIMRLGDKSAVSGVDVISTGSMGLDLALGIGGLPRGRVVEIYGPESSGKTTLALHVVAQAQKLGLTATYIDAEHALDAKWAKKLGVDVDSLYLSQPDNGEAALEITDTLIRSGAVGVCVVDSVAALVPRAEVEGEMGDHHMALQARLMSQAMRKLTANLNRSGCLLIFINQIRNKVGVVFGSPDTTSGGNALKFYSSIRMEIRRIGQVKRGDEAVANATRVKVVKNKLSPPFRQAEFDITYQKGICMVSECLDLCVAHGLVTKRGSWYMHEPSGTQLGQGKDKAREALEQMPELFQQLQAELRDTLNDNQLETISSTQHSAANAATDASETEQSEDEEADAAQ